MRKRGGSAESSSPCVEVAARCVLIAGVVVCLVVHVGTHRRWWWGLVDVAVLTMAHTTSQHRIVSMMWHINGTLRTCHNNDE
jgi:hypothetical protein